MPQRAVYSEERSGVRWPLVAIAILGWVLLIGGGIATSLPHLAGLAVLAIIGAILALISTVLLRYSLAAGIRVYEDKIQIGGLRGRDRRLRRGKWPPRKLSAGAQSRAVFTCPWQATDGLYLITGQSEIKRIRRDLGGYRKRTDVTRIPLGVLDQAASFANALLVISVDPRRTESEPRELGVARGQYGRISPVVSPTWLTPVRNAGALRAALERLPQAPPVHDRLPSEGTVRFEVG
jgi:hypothetical protein